jgi:hypothetical protein
LPNIRRLLYEKDVHFLIVALQLEACVEF